MVCGERFHRLWSMAMATIERDILYPRAICRPNNTDQAGIAVQNTCFHQSERASLSQLSSAQYVIVPFSPPMVRLLLFRQVWGICMQSKRAEWVVVALHVSWGSLPLILRHRTSTRHSTNNSCMSASHVIMWIWVRCTVQALHCWVSLFTYSWMVCTSGVVGVQRKQVGAVANIF